MGERADTPNAWQFPQGGIDPGETPEQALVREMKEEVGIDTIQILKRGADVIYNFPTDLKSAVAKRYLGQRQTWFLLQAGTGWEPDLTRCDKEFVRFTWKTPEDIIDSVIIWKRDAYRQGLASLNIGECIT